MNAHPYLRPWLDGRQLEPTRLDRALVRDRLEVARKHYEWALHVRTSLPTEHALHLTLGYDALRSAAGALVRAHGMRGKGDHGKSHAVALDIAIACLQARRPDAGAALAPIATELRVLRNHIQYEAVSEVSTEQCDELFSVLVPILDAMEDIAYELIGLPAPGGWPLAT